MACASRLKEARRSAYGEKKRLGSLCQTAQTSHGILHFFKTVGQPDYFWLMARRKLRQRKWLEEAYIEEAYI